MYIAMRRLRTSFKIFRALLDVKQRMRRLSQALQIEYKKDGVYTCIDNSKKFFSEMNINKVTYRRNH